MDGLELSQGALSALTDRIDKKFNPAKSKSPKTSKSQQKAPSTSKKDKSTKQDVQSKAETPKKNATALVTRKESKTKHKSREQKRAPTEDNKGKKRFHGGQVKETAKEAPHVNGNDEVAGRGLREEILALGGTEEDLALINDVASDSEVEGTSSHADGALGKDLKKLLQELGVSEQSANQQLDTSEESDQDSGSGEEAEDSHLTAAKTSASKLGTGKQSTESNDTRPPTSSNGLLIEPRSEWHSAELPTLPDSSSDKSLPQPSITGLHEYAKELLQTEAEKYATLNKTSSSAYQFYSTIMSSGTLSDKISALTLSIQESPLHNLKALETLVGLSKKRSRAQAIDVLIALKDLLGPGSLLPSDRKLRHFASQPGLYSSDPKQLKKWTKGQPLPKPCHEAHLVSWAFEDWLKSSYFEILQVLESWCSDELVYSRTKAVDIVFHLLRDKPEQEANLLRLLVNKLGDTEKKIASRASYNLLQLQIPHPLMKSTIINAIEEDILFKPGQSLHAKYYAIITLNQTVLSSKEDIIVRKILDIYFSLFVFLLASPSKTPVEVTKVTVNSKGERQGGGGQPGKMAQKKKESQAHSTTPEEQLREKAMSAVLTGINRAVPYTDTNDEFFAKHLDTLFKITHSSNFNTSIQALMLIQQLCGSHQAASDRFYRTLYESLLDPRLLNTSKQALYLNLLYRALRADLNEKRVKAFAKRLLQVVTMHQPAFASAVIYLLRELESQFPTLPLLIDEPQEGVEDEDEEFHDVPGGDDSVQVTKSSNGTSSSNPRYDARKRAPEHASAERSCLWELSPFLEHYHPSVNLFAQRLLVHSPMPPKPTLDSHTMIQFLDRFVYKNPKKTTDKTHGSSVMQPLSGGDTSSLLITARGNKDKIAVNSDAFSRMSSDKVDVADAFFHQYFQNRDQGKDLAKQKKEKKKAQEDDSNADDDEDEIWQALVDSHPEVDGPGSDSDMEMEDYSDSEFDENDLFEEAPAPDDETQDDIEEEAGSGGDSDAPEFDDEDALLDSDDEIPSDLDMALDTKVPTEAQKAAKSARQEKKESRRKFKSLPTFASVEDYAAMLEDNEDEDR